MMLAIAGVILLVAGLGSLYLRQPQTCARLVQKSVVEVETEIQDLIGNNSNYHQYDKAKVGLFVFHNDSLLYWNNNLVGPKLIRRKVKPDCDTICNLLTGDYYVRTFSKGHLDYYVFKLLNTTYRLENDFFENRFLPFHGLIDSKIHFTENEGFEIKSSQGK